MPSSSIFVVGSANTDMVLQVPRLPKPGETIIGNHFKVVQGGKGANQAVAARRAGGVVYFVGCVGKDDFGKNTRASLSSEGIQVAYLAQDSQASSGVALILVDEKGENCIAVASGANHLLLPSDVAAALDLLSESDVVLVQQEIPVEVVRETIIQGRNRGALVILNPAPAREIDADLFPHLSFLVPNETETEVLTGIRIATTEHAQQAASQLLERGVANVLITLGAAGVWVANRQDQQLIRGYEVNAVDTTAAGDVFCGALAVALTEQQDLLSAVQFANAAAALSVTKAGAQPSAPVRTYIDEFIALNQVIL
jgi:ribokinase